MIQFKIHDPNHPYDESRAIHLSLEQFAVVRDYIVECINARQGRGEPVNERRVRQMLQDAGCPLDFNLPRS